jgi:secreted trypsin-like serine protease
MRKQTILPWLLLLAGGFGMLLTGCVAPTATSSTAQPIIGGTTVTTDPAVVLLVATIGRSGQAYCTAEIVSPHVVMTAAHCVDPSELGGTATFQVFLGADINGSMGNDQSLYLDVKETHFNSQFDGNQVENGNDVGVAILSAAAPVTPILMNRTALTNADVGQPLRLVGFGIDSGNDQQGSSAGTKRQVSTPLTSYDSLFIDFGTAQKGTCEGDSGGPAFMTINGQEVITGITSFGPQGCNGDSTDTRVDTISVPFIDPYIQANDPGYTPGSTTGTTGSTGSTTGSTGGTTGSTTGSSTGSTGGTTGSTTGSGTGSTGSSTGSTGGTTGSTTGSSTGSTGGSTGSTTGSSTGSTGGSTGSSTGGTTGTLSGCNPTAPNSCPANYECVVAAGVGECILAPKVTPQSKTTSDSGCSVGGHSSPAAPAFFFVFLGVLFVRRKFV